MNRILIVVDVQNDFIDGSLGSNEAKAILPKVKEKIERYTSRVMRLYLQEILT